MKLWIDDVREPPDRSWTWARSFEVAISRLILDEDKIEVVSFDHDLGEEYSGYDLLCQIEKWVHDEQFPYRVPKLEIHSANPVGVENMQRVIRAIEEFVR